MQFLFFPLELNHAIRLVPFLFLILFALLEDVIRLTTTCDDLFAMFRGVSL